jgi:hypothetical protein
MENGKSKIANRKRQISKSQTQKRLLASEKLARRTERWYKRLVPQYPDIDPHDLHLIITELLKTRKERMELMFLKRREDGIYVF